MMTELVITVYGTPAPQGSKRHVGNGVMVESSKKVKPWREDVRAAAFDAMEAMTRPMDDDQIRAAFQRLDGQALAVSITFYLKRPKGHYRTGKNSDLIRDGAPTLPTTRPDIDKLMRSTLDALGSAGTYADDSQIVSLYGWKCYADARPAGAEIRVSPLITDGPRLLRDAGYGSGEEATG